MSPSGFRSAGRLDTRGSLAALALLALAAAWMKARSYDLGWHLEAGEQILRTWAIPSVDDFSFTSRGTPWIDHEWLFQVALHLLHAGLGWAGLTLMKAACAFGSAAAGFAAMRRAGASAGEALAIVAVAMTGMQFRLAERPEIVSLLLAPCVAFQLLAIASGRQPGWKRRLLLVASGVVWVNFHAGALLGPALAVACAAGRSIEAALAPGESRGPAARSALRLWEAAGLLALSLAASPSGYHVLLVPFRIQQALAPGNLVNPEWLPPAAAAFPWLFAALPGCALAVLISIRRRRDLSICRAGMLALAGGLALTGVRHVGLFYALMPLLVDPASLRIRMPGRIGGAAWPGWIGAALAAAAAAGMLLWPPSGGVPGLGLQSGRFPEKAADFLDGRMSGVPMPRIYNDVAFGGYLIWRGYPGRRVFIDGRNEVHARLLRELSSALDDARRWDALLDRHGVEGAVVAYRDEAVRAVDAATGAASLRPFSELHFPAARWALVYWDDVAMVFVRRQGRLAGLAETEQYHEVRPEAFRLGLAKTDTVKKNAAAAGEILRRLREDPGCQLANAMAAAAGIPGAASGR